MAEVEVQNGVDKTNGTTITPVVFSCLKPQIRVEAPKAKDAVEFYKNAFGAEEVSRVLHTKRKADLDLPLLLSAHLKISSSLFSVSDLLQDSSLVKDFGGGGIALCLETEDVEGAISKAVNAGAVVEEDELSGAVAKVKDPYGYLWIISSPLKKSADVEA